jgi:transcriptional regulator of acetoin/glycerol metabolism
MSDDRREGPPEVGIAPPDFNSLARHGPPDSGKVVEQDTTEIVQAIKHLFDKAYSYGSFPVVAAVQRELIINALEATAGNYMRAAEILGITRTTLRKRVAQFRIKRVFTVR